MNRGYHFHQPTSGLSTDDSRLTTDSVGFTAPARIWPKIDEIEASAASLNRDIQAYASSSAFRAAWDTWYRNWRQNYYEKYQGTLARIGALSGSDELNRQVENQREQLRGWYEQYRQQTQATGRPVPTPSGLAPLLAPDPRTGAGWSLPWWFWLTAGAATLYIGYRFYVTYRMAQARARVLEDRFVPAVLERYGLPGQEGREVLQAGRDQVGREQRDARLTPFDLAYYARDAGRESANSQQPTAARESANSRQPTADRAGDRSTSFDLPAYGYNERDDSPNFAYDRLRDPLSRRFG